VSRQSWSSAEAAVIRKTRLVTLDKIVSVARRPEVAKLRALRVVSHGGDVRRTDRSFIAQALSALQPYAAVLL
jgi:hypothetical protein